MATALKVFACVFSFAFTAYFGGALFSLFFTPIAIGVAESGVPFLGGLIEIIPPVLAILGGLQSARVALRLEEARQRKAAEKK